MHKGILALAMLLAIPPASATDTDSPNITQTAACMSVGDSAGREPCDAAKIALRVDVPTQYWVCSLQSVYFSQCLAQLADRVVRVDPKLPPARVLYRIALSDPAGGNTRQVDVLAGDEGEISDTLGDMRFHLSSRRAVDGSIVLDYQLDGLAQAKGSYSFHAGDTQSVSLGAETVTISRL